MSELQLSSPITKIKGVGPKLGQIFNKKGLHTVEDVLYFLPRAYQDRTQTTPIGSIEPGTQVSVQGYVIRSRQYRRGRALRLEVIFGDETGEIELVWFHAHAHFKKQFEANSKWLVHGTAKIFGARLQITHPDLEKIQSDEQDQRGPNHFGKILPIYSETEGLNQKTIRKVIQQALLDCGEDLEENLPSSILNKLNAPSLKQSFRDVHLPLEIPNEGRQLQSLKRLIFEEFFLLQLGLSIRKYENQQIHTAHSFIGDLEPFLRLLPFSLTGDQQKVLKEILKDMGTSTPMARLIQGDVGCGKTVVALAASYLVIQQGYQVALMAPTEVLARQHYKLALDWFSQLDIAVTLVLGGKQQSAQVCDFSGPGLYIGTHALFQKKVKFKSLSFVIIDEQHRFGVKQRSLLLKKSNSNAAHLLLMSATPIPRTLALTLHGDLDLSIIREKPAGRKEIDTRILLDYQRPQLYEKIRRTVRDGEQVYFIYPLVEASDRLDLKSATEMYDRLRKEVFPNFSLGLVHGRMDSDEKDGVIEKFKRNELQILVSTTVIEVGIDVPNATLMVIEHPERLGLSQLHQLRGRVGRGSKQSYCLLMVEKYITERLKILKRTQDGFEIAEADLKLRGPGEFLGTRQHGLSGFKIGDLVRDTDLLEFAREEALSLLQKDPELQMPQHQGIRKMLRERWASKIEWVSQG